MDSTVNSTHDMETASSLPPSMDVDISPNTTALGIDQGTNTNPPDSTPDPEEDKEALDSEASEKCTKTSVNTGGEFQACTKIVREILERREAGNGSRQVYGQEMDSVDDEAPGGESIEKSEMSVKENRDDESMEREENTNAIEDDRSKLVSTTPRKKKQGHSRPKKSKPTQDEEEGEAGCEEESGLTPKKRGRPRKTKEGETYSPPCRRKNPHIARLPGSRLKICSHCGTVADKVKAKKCPNCKKFFFSHWAQRCKIPPCPNCHFSRKSRRFERFPSNCEKCGFKLPYDMAEQQSPGLVVEEGDGVESVESSSTSARITPDPSELDGIPGEWSEGKPDVFDNAEYEETAEMEEDEVEEKKPGKGKGKRKSRTEAAVISTDKTSAVQSLIPQDISMEGTIMATTRSGRAYKQTTSPEAVSGGKKVSKGSGQAVTELSPQPSATPSMGASVSETSKEASDADPKSPATTSYTQDNKPLEETLFVDATPLTSVGVAELGATVISTVVEISRASLTTAFEEVATKTAFQTAEQGASNTPLSTSVGEVKEENSNECPRMDEVANTTQPLSSATTPQPLSPAPLPVSPVTTPDPPSPAISPIPEHQPLSPPAPATETSTAAPLEAESVQPPQPTLSPPLPLTPSPPQPPEEQRNDKVQELENNNQSSSGSALFVDQEVQVVPCGALQVEQCPSIPMKLPPTSVELCIDVAAESGGKEANNRRETTCASAVVASDAAEQTQRETKDSSYSEPLPMAVDPIFPPVSQLSDPPFMLSSAVQTDGITDGGDKKGESEEGQKVEVFSNISRSLPFLHSVLSHAQGVSEQGDSLGALSATFKDVATSTTTATTSGGSVGLPVLYTSNLQGLEDPGKSQPNQNSSTVSSAGSSNFPILSTASTDIQSTSITEACTITTNALVSETSVSIPAATESVAPPCDDMVVTESGTLPTATLNSGPPDPPKTTAKPAQKQGKGKGAVGKDGKPLTSRKRKQPKSQEKKEETKQSKPRKPRTKKSKVMTATPPTVTEEQSTAAISMLATSIAQELQRKPSMSSSMVLGQHPKHSFSQYFYTEDGGKFASSLGPAEPSGSGFSEGPKTSSTKRSPSKLKESQEPPLKKKKLAAIAPNNPLTSTASAPGGAMGQLPLKIPQLCHQLASTLRMSSSGILSLLQTVLSTQNPSIAGISGGGIVSSASGTSLVACSSSSSATSNPLPTNFFPPLTMSFQSLAAVLSNMPIATAPIRLSGTQVTARPLLPSASTTSATQTLSTTTFLPTTTATLPLSLPTMFPSLGPPGSVPGEQLLAQSEASVGTQTAVKMDTLKSFMPAISSSLSPQLLTLPNPPQLTASPTNLPPLPPPAPPPSLVARDLKPLFQSVLFGQQPSPPPPPLTSTPEFSLSSTSTSTAAVPLPVIQSNVSSSSYVTLPMTSAPMFTSLPFLPTHTNVLSFPIERTNVTLPQVPSDPGVQPLLISSLPEPSSTNSAPSQALAGLGSLLPPPPHLLPQPPYPPSSTAPSFPLTSRALGPGGEPSSSNSLLATSHYLTAPAPLIPSLLRPGISSGAVPGSISSGLPPLGHQQVIYTQSITSPKVCPGLQPASTTTSVDTNLQVLVTNVQSRINEALSKSAPESKASEPAIPLPPVTTTAAVFPLVPPPLTPLSFVSKGPSSTSHAQYLMPHPPPQKKRGVVITKLPGPILTALSHAGDRMGREGSRHSSSSSLKSGDDSLIPVQSVKGSKDVLISSTTPAVITLSPSPTGSLEEGQFEASSVVGLGSSRDKPQILDQDSDKESDSYAKLMSEETLVSDGSSEGEGPGSKVEMVGGASGDQRYEQQESKYTVHSGNDTDGRKRAREKVEEKEGWEGGAKERDSEKGKQSKKRRKSSSGSSGKKTHMFSVKLKDCFLHHLTWMDYRMVLLVPLGEKDRLTHSLDSATHHLPPTPHTSDPQEGQGQSSETGDKPAGGGERRRRRKPVLKELSGYDMEEGADDEDMSTSTTSSVHVPGPCFSVYELRNKLFMTLSPNAVYIYTYKNQIKSFKLPIHWVYILKRMGGMLESCHTCRLMDLEHVRGMCTHYGLSLPDTLDSLCRNELPKGRRVIDLSSIEPESLGPLHLEEIPLCSFTEKGRPYKPKSKKNKKKWRKEEEHRSKRKADIMVDLETRRSSGKDQGREVKESVDGGGRKVPKASTSSSVGGERELLEGEEELEGGEEGERGGREEEEEGGGREGEAGNWVLNKKEKHHKLGKHSPPPLIKRQLSPISSRTKKKPCPFCGAQVLKRSKKCSVCNKNFGVYTFGRKQCLFCGRVNLARMARCNECGQSLDKAPSARPKEEEESCASSSSSHKRSDFIFGVRKRRKVHSVPLAFSGGFYSGYHHHHHQHQQLASSSPSISSPKMRRSYELQSPVERGRGAQDEVVSDEEEMEEGWREEGWREEGGGEEGWREEGGGEEGGEDTQEEEVLTKMTPATDGETAVKTKTISRTKSTSSSNPKQAGYQYGHIPWGDADITVLVDEKGVTKFCLQELIAKVLAGHAKAEVFDMVRDLDLPLEQGNLQLLKKLQALGLHANRSPMCKLIATEELWLLLDALQEPVPEEVHQHLENINTSTTPLLSPGSISIRTAAVVATAPPTTNSAEEEEQTKSFESTLHEMQCSDGQYISVLRKWNGEQYVCLPEMWRKYFPEVNRNHLSSALRRLELETLMPTAQQATLLRSAQVISIRGAPGRLMKLEHMQALLDDFCIPLQLATGSTQEHDPDSKDKQVKQPVSLASTTGVLKPVGSRPVGRPRLHIPQPSLPPGKVLASREDMEYAQCMRNVLTSVNSSDLVALLEETRLESVQQAEVADSHANDVDSQLDRLGQLIHTRRELSTVLSREMGFLNASVHGYMSEVVRITHTEKQVLQNLDTLLSSLKISLL